MVSRQGWWRRLGKRGALLVDFVADLADDPVVAELLGVNRYDGIDWFVAESFDALLHALAVAVAIDDPPGVEVSAAASALQRMTDARDASGFRVDRLLDLLDDAG
jgi:hypothetical protein